MNDDEKTCPRCAEAIKKAAVVCRYCGHEFAGSGSTPKPVASVKAQQKLASVDTKNRNGLFGCLGLILFVALIGQCAGDNNGNSEPSSGSDNALANATFNASTEPNSDTPRSNWRATSYRDEVRGQMVHNASIVSENEVEFDFPYAGGSSLTITVRKHPKYGEDVVFQISDGQFICGIYDCQGAISFDGKTETLSLVPPEDHDSKTLFAKYGSGIIRKLKNSKKVVVELTFYQEGNRQFTFRTEGLVWPPKN